VPRDPRSLALRLERAEAEQLARTGPPGRAGALEIGGGLAVFKGPRSPFSAAFALGLDGPVRAREVERVEAHLGQGGGPVRVELASPADPSLAAELGRRGYRLERFHLVWWRGLEGWEDGSSPAREARAVVRPIARGEERAFAEVFARAFYGRPPTAEMERGLLEMTRAEGNACFACFERSAPVAVAIASAHGGVATLSGAGVLPERRGRGLQLALVRARLAWARSNGCDVAASATDPATASQRTLEKADFRCAYPKAVMVRSAGA
jgi:GNAT superfamily N-acetyltransferase